MLNGDRMRVVIADDQRLVRAGVVRLLEARGHSVVGEARDGFEALELARSLRPDLVLMDIGMARCSGLEATRLIKAELPGVKVVLVTEKGGERVAAASTNPDGYVLKEGTGDELELTLAAVAESRREEFR